MAEAHATLKRPGFSHSAVQAREVLLPCTELDVWQAERWPPPRWWYNNADTSSLLKTPQKKINTLEHGSSITEPNKKESIMP
jgi:hypothetical protein